MSKYNKKKFYFPIVSGGKTRWEELKVVVKKTKNKKDNYYLDFVDNNMRYLTEEEKKSLVENGYIEDAWSDYL